MNRTRHILRDLRRDLVKNRWIYIMAIPVIAFYILFSYIPMAGVQIAFKDYNFGAGIWGSHGRASSISSHFSAGLTPGEPSGIPCCSVCILFLLHSRCLSYLHCCSTK